MSASEGTPARKGVGQPGLVESMVPVWGNGRAALDHYQNGEYWQAAAYTALAVSDIFMIKAAAVAITKGVAGIAVKTSGKELFNFSSKAASHMGNPGRAVPIQILEQAINGSKGVADPRGSRALLHVTEMWKNGKPYNLEVLYDKASNSIWHFQYNP